MTLFKKSERPRSVPSLEPNFITKEAADERKLHCFHYVKCYTEIDVGRVVRRARCCFCGFLDWPEAYEHATTARHGSYGRIGAIRKLEESELISYFDFERVCNKRKEDD